MAQGHWILLHKKISFKDASDNEFLKAEGLFNFYISLYVLAGSQSKKCSLV